MGRVCKLALEEQQAAATVYHKWVAGGWLESKRSVYAESLGGRGLQDLLPSSILALVDKFLDFLSTSAGGDEQSVRSVDDDQIVDTQAGHEAAGAGDDDTSCDLFGDDYVREVIRQRERQMRFDCAHPRTGRREHELVQFRRARCQRGS